MYAFTEKRFQYFRSSCLYRYMLVIGLTCMSFAGAQPNLVGLSPARFELTAVPGQLLDEHIFAFGRDNRTFVVTPSLLDWTVSSSGGVELLDPNVLEQSASAWVNITVSPFELQRNQNLRIPFTIRVPDDAAPGVYRTALAFTTDARVNPEAVVSEEQASIAFRSRVASIVYVIVEPVSHQGRVVDAFVEDAHSVFVINNEGTGLLRFNGSLEYVGVDGQVIHRETLSERVVLPDGRSELRRPLLSAEQLPSRAVLLAMNLTDSNSGLQLYGEIPLP